MSETSRPPAIPAAPRKKRRGFLNPGKVRAVVFYITTVCIIISVGTCIRMHSL